MAKELGDQIIAHQKEAELLFCTSVYLQPGIAIEECGWLDEAIFLDERTKSFWGKVRKGEPVASAAIDSKIYDEILKNMGNVISSIYVDSYAKAIANDRYLLDVSKIITNIAKNISERDIEKTRENALRLSEYTPKRTDEVQNIADIALKVHEELDDKPDIVKTGIKNLDYLTGGLYKSNVTILAGRPSMGKTAFLYQIAENVAGAEQQVLYYSPEMTSEDLLKRAACGRARVSTRDLMAGRLLPDQKENVKKKLFEIIEKTEDRLRIEDKAIIKIDDIWSNVANYHPSLVIVDHIGLVNRISKTISDDVKLLGNTSWAGKAIAKQFNCAFVFAMQLNRDVEKRDDKRPKMSDLRASGEVEQDADSVWFIYRDSYYNNNVTTKSETEIIVSKFRNGPVPLKVELIYDMILQQFFPKEFSRD
jgi:replicative DNA helicase